jgi:hypothetical protein
MTELTPSNTAYTAKQWGSRDLVKPDPLLGMFSAGSRTLFSAETGLGKTMLAMTWAYAMAFGREFLHWKSHRPARVLYLDGELPGYLLKERIATVYRFFDIDPDDKKRPDGPYFLSHEDNPTMPPIDTLEGQRWLDDKLKHEQFRDLDFIVFDNLQALCSGNMKDEESWRGLQSWTRALIRRGIGQLWVHHTGRIKTHAYETVTREFGMETCMLALAEGSQDNGPTFRLEFTKATSREPKNAADFATVILALKDGKWSCGEAEKVELERVNSSEVIALKALQTCITELGGNIPERVWREQMIKDGITKSDKKGSRDTACRRARDQLLDDGKVVQNDDGTFALRRTVIPFRPREERDGDGEGDRPTFP